MLVISLGDVDRQIGDSSVQGNHIIDHFSQCRNRDLELRAFS